MTRLGGLAQGFQGRDRGQHSDGRAGTEPCCLTIVGKLGRNGSLWRLGDEHIEGQAGEGSRGHDEQALALDEVLGRPKQCPIELVCAGEVERQDLSTLLPVADL